MIDKPEKVRFDTVIPLGFKKHRLIVDTNGIISIEHLLVLLITYNISALTAIGIKKSF